MGILSSEKGIRRLTLPTRSLSEARRKLCTSEEASDYIPRALVMMVESLRRYFAGDIVEFPDKIDVSGATVFQRKVWETTRRIPYGESRSYSWIAEQIGDNKACRAAGNALGKNPVPIIIPCHRVLAKNGGLGGFSGGIEMKKLLLLLEAANRDKPGIPSVPARQSIVQGAIR